MLAQAVPMGMRSSSAKSRRMGYQVQSTVTSVGPYKLMYWTWGKARFQRLSCLARSVSPPTITVRRVCGAFCSSTPELATR